MQSHLITSIRPRRVAQMLLLTGLLLLCLPGQSAVSITEFLAANDGGLQDEDQESPDWVELFNSGPGVVNLDGWHLTDDPAILVKWTFPATNLPAGGFLVVFASGKNRVLSGQPLHTNFQLNNSGGYLALVEPDGVTVAHDYAPTYPNQRANVSYGLVTEATITSLIGPGAIARVLVPTEGTLGLTWTGMAFNDAAWFSSNAPVAFAVGVTNSTLLALDVNERGMDAATTTAAGFTSLVINSNGSASTIQTQATARVFDAITVTITNLAPYGYDDRQRTTPTDSGAFTDSLLLQDFIFSRDDSGTGGLDVSLSGLTPNQPYQLTVWSYDTGSPGNRVSDWSANGVPVITDYTFDGNVLPTANDQYRFSFDTAADGAGGLLLSGRRDPTSSTFGVFLNALRIETVSAAPGPTNGLAALMLGNNATAYIRIPFLVADPTAFQSLKLRMKYDDGFVAYLNGQLVAARNAPGTPSWNSTATAARSDSDNLVFEDIMIPNSPGLLVAGTNVLAIQGLNVTVSDPDFLIESELQGLGDSTSVGRYFSPPTPGAANGTGYLGLVSDTKFSADRGFYDMPFTVAITSATATASIYWTTNGSTPSPTNGTLYTSPISILGTKFLRAAAFLTDYVPSVPDTHTYIFLDQVLQQSTTQPGYPTTWQANYPADYGMDANIVNDPGYGQTISNDLRSLPTLSIVSDQNGLWNSATGIYPNATSSGPAWERAASIELIRGDGHTEFQENCKIQMHGNASLDNVRTPKHSFGLSFSSDYGPSKLRYDWFGGVTVADKIVLRACGFVDGWAGRYADDGIYTSTETGETFRGLRYRPENTCYLRDAWVKDSFRAMGWSASRSQYVHLYLNGLYWGLYEPSEHVDASYFSQLLGGQKSAWDVVVGEDNNGPPVLVDGSLTDWNNVLSLVNAGISSEAEYAAVTNLVDVDNLIDYMLLHIFAESEDWPRHNWYVAHRRATNGIPATKFICTVWDQELTLDRLVRRNRVDVGDTGGEIYSPARVYRQLRNWPEFRQQFGERIQKHLFNGGALTPSNNVARLLGPAALIHDALTGEAARWGDARKTGVPAGQTGTGVTFTRDGWWQPEIDQMATNFFQHLTDDNLARFRAASLYPSVSAPEFSQFGGAISNGFELVLTHTNATGAIYFTLDGSDPRTYGTGTVSPTAQAYATPILFNGPAVVRARVLSSGNWSALVEATFYPPQDLGKLTLTEIMYHPPDLGATSGNGLEFLELKNDGTNTLDLSGLTFTSGITFTFTNGTLLAPGQFFVLVSDAAAFAGKYPGVTIGGAYTGQLDNGGEKLTLAHPLGATVLSVSYDDRPPWPVTPDIADFSLVPRNPGTSPAPDQGSSWRASTNPGGSPGADDPPPNIAPVVIDEILTHTDPPQQDAIELYNPTSTNVNVSGWFLTDDASVPKKFRIPDNTIVSAGGRAYFDEADFNPTPGVGDSFALSSTGDDVYLFSATPGGQLTGYDHGITLGAAFNGVSFGRYVNSAGEEFYPAQTAVTLGQANSGPRIGPVVISEIQYHPDVNGDEFIELLNITDGAVSLQHPDFPTNTWKLSGVDFTFPGNVVLGSNATLLVVATDPAAFRAKYSIPANVQIFGPYAGQLQDSGENLELRAPDNPNTNGVPYVVMDAVRYNDKLPWPPAADGSGLSLQRVPAAGYGNEPTNWIAAAPTPGQASGTGDSDGDGLPDWWEQANGTFVFVPDANDDPDGDGFTNWQEFLAGTQPHAAASALRFQQITANGDRVVMQFLAASNHTYTVLQSPLLETGTWSKLADVIASSTNRLASVTNTTAGSTARFYRLVTPAQP